MSGHRRRSGRRRKVTKRQQEAPPDSFHHPLPIPPPSVSTSPSAPSPPPLSALQFPIPKLPALPKGDHKFPPILDGTPIAPLPMDDGDSDENGIRNGNGSSPHLFSATVSGLTTYAVRSDPISTMLPPYNNISTPISPSSSKVRKRTRSPNSLSATNPPSLSLGLNFANISIPKPIGNDVPSGNSPSIPLHSSPNHAHINNSYPQDTSPSSKYPPLPNISRSNGAYYSNSPSSGDSIDNTVADFHRDRKNHRAAANISLFRFNNGTAPSNLPVVHNSITKKKPRSIPRLYSISSSGTSSGHTSDSSRSPSNRPIRPIEPRGFTPSPKGPTMHMDILGRGPSSTETPHASKDNSGMVINLPPINYHHHSHGEQPLPSSQPGSFGVADNGQPFSQESPTKMSLNPVSTCKDDNQSNSSSREVQSDPHLIGIQPPAPNLKEIRDGNESLAQKVSKVQSNPGIHREIEHPSQGEQRDTPPGIPNVISEHTTQGNTTISAEQSNTHPAGISHAALNPLQAKAASLENGTISEDHPTVDSREIVPTVPNREESAANQRNGNSTTTFDVQPNSKNLPNAPIPEEKERERIRGSTAEAYSNSDSRPGPSSLSAAGTYSEFDEDDAADLFLTETKVQTWFRDQSEPIEQIRIDDLVNFCQGNRDVWINPPLKDLTRYSPPVFSCTEELSRWERNTKEPLEKRRVMMWCVAEDHPMSFIDSPILSEVSRILRSPSGLEVLSLASLTKGNRSAPPMNASDTHSMQTSCATARDMRTPSPSHSHGNRDTDRTVVGTSKGDDGKEEVASGDKNNFSDAQPQPIRTVTPPTPELTVSENNMNMNGAKSSGAVTHARTARGELSNSSAKSNGDTHAINGKRMSTGTGMEKFKKRRYEDTNGEVEEQNKRQKVANGPSTAVTTEEERVEENIALTKQDPKLGIVILKLRMRPNRQSTWLRLRIRKEKIAFGILKPKQIKTVRVVDKAYLKSFVYHKIIARFRSSGLLTGDAADGYTERFLSDTPVLWDTKNMKKVSGEGVPESHGEVFRKFLLYNPHLEQYTGQDKVHDFGVKNHLQYIELSGRAPSSLAIFWSKSRRRVQRHDKVNGISRSVAHCADKFKGLEMYIGQDLRNEDVYSALKATSLMLNRRGMGITKSYWCLVARPSTISYLAHNGWTAKYASVHLQLASETVFWNLEERCLHLEPKASGSMGHYIRENNGTYEPYSGQDLDQTDKFNLKDWFKILEWGPGNSFKDMVPILDGYNSARNEIAGEKRKPLPETAMHRPIFKGKESRKQRDKRRRERKDRKKKKPDEQRAKSRKKQELTKKNARNKRAAEAAAAAARKEISQADDNMDTQDDEITDSDAAAVPTAEFCGHIVSAARANELKSMKPGDYVIVRHVEKQVALPAECGPTREQLEEFFRAHEGYEIFDKYRHRLVNENADKQGEEEYEEESYTLAHLAAERESKNIEEIVLYILKRACQGDEFEAIYVELEELLSVCGNFGVLMKSLREGEGVKNALKLMDSLEELDVHNLITDVDCHESKGLEDLFSIREEIAQGKVIMSHEVILRFRNVCATTIQYHRGHTVVQALIQTLFARGEQHFARFFESNLEAMRRDLYTYRIHNLTKKAMSRLEVAKGVRHQLLQESQKENVKRTVPQRNAYLNYRDEQGNSIMSQRMGSKVLGLVIENNPNLLDSINGRGHWKVDSKCHICSKFLAQPYNDGIPCARRLFKECSYVVCRDCFCKGINEPQPVFRFLEERAKGAWKCFHCSGACYNMKRGCARRKPKPEILGEAQHVEFTFDCTHTGWKEDTILAKFMRITREGDEEPSRAPIGVPGTRYKENGKSLWKCHYKLSPGLYHVRMKYEGKHAVSSKLYVWPEDFGRRNNGNSKGSRKGNISGRVQVSWELGASTGNTVPESLRCDPIKECSRTEGYNWTAAKRHSIQRYRPVVTGNVPAQSPTVVTTNCNPVVPSNSNIPGIDSNAELYDRVMRQEGRTIEEYQLELNRKMFEKMKESAWGLYIARSYIHGSGMFTLSGYGTGDIIAEYTGELIRGSTGDARERTYDAKNYGSYMFRLDENYLVDATIRSNRTRFINHSCDPNMVSEIIQLPDGKKVIVFKASRPIPPFSELTFDYQFPHEAQRRLCLCKSWRCSGFMN